MNDHLPTITEKFMPNRKAAPRPRFIGFSGPGDQWDPMQK